MDHPEIHATIEKLVVEEHALWEREAAGSTDEDDRRRLRQSDVS